MKKSQILAIFAAMFLAVGSAHGILSGDNVTLGTAARQAALESAVTGAGNSFYGNKNAKAKVLNANVPFQAFGTWMELDELAGSNGNGANNIFKVNLTSGSWGSGDAAGTWEILDTNFWTSYAYGAISLHVGGNTTADHFVWRLTPDKLSGTWAYDLISGGGGGLSNLKLYKAGKGTGVPDTGSTLVLLGLGIGVLGFLKRRK